MSSSVAGTPSVALRSIVATQRSTSLIWQLAASASWREAPEIEKKNLMTKVFFSLAVDYKNIFTSIISN